jgi:hypothetical protein
LLFYIIPEADISLSYDWWATSAVLKAWVWIWLKVLEPIIYVKWTEWKTISIYNWSFQTIFNDWFFWTDANHTEFEADGTLKMVWDATVYNDIIISPSNLRWWTTAPDFATFQDNVYQLKFINWQTDIVYWSFEIPHGYKEWSNLELHLHRSPSTTNTGNCVFNFEYTIANMWSWTFWTTAQKTLTEAWSWVVNKHQYMSWNTVIDWTNIKIWDVIVFALSRPLWDAFSWDAFVHSVWIHYQWDTLWSRSATWK